MKPNLGMRRVFFVGNNSIFEDGLAHLLTNAINIQVSTARYIDDIWFLDAIAQNQPDVILLSESGVLNSHHLLNLLFSRPALTDLQIIIVRLTDTMVDVYKLPKQIGREIVYKQQHFNVTTHDDLIAIIRGDFACIHDHDLSLDDSSQK